LADRSTTTPGAAGSSESMQSTSQRHLTVIKGLPDFWERVHRAPHRLLSIDYDGTLAPFRLDRTEARPLDGVHDALSSIAADSGTSLAILSGRASHEIRELLGRDLHIPIYGSHGYECVHADGREEKFPPAEDQLQVLQQAAQSIVDAGLTSRLEKKIASVAVHTRGLSDLESVEARFMKLWQPLTSNGRLAVMHFNQGVEIRALGRNKGTALRTVYESMPPDTLPIYIGDDTTDEDAFRFLKTRGIGIKVGKDNVPTEAIGRVPDEPAVLDILLDWRHAATPSQ
jgi:trehalose 6-phosphate phosphatase